MEMLHLELESAPGQNNLSLFLRFLCEDRVCWFRNIGGCTHGLSKGTDCRYDREVAKTRKMLEAIPSDADFTWKPHPKSMSWAG